MEQGRALAPLTTLGLGGPAEYFARVEDRTQLREALDWAADRPVRILGGGSNLVIADEGVPGLVIQLATRGIERDGELLTVQAGEPWDDVVEFALGERLSGIECLSGIPGSTGATPIQNVGAYGQEVSQVIEGVEVLERATGVVRWLRADECGFAYRDSMFKRSESYILLAVRFRLRSDGVPTLRYPELARAVSEKPTLREVQRAVRSLRSAKGMLIDEGFVPCVGSFFTNPIVSIAHAKLVSAAPQWPTDDGRVKLSAAWLIEHAGNSKGTRRGGVGISSRHSLALVHHGGGTTAALMELAREVQERVRSIFNITLEIEPVRWPQNA